MSDEVFRALFEGALDSMLLADDDARYVDANPAACVFLGLSRAEIRRLRVVDFAPEPAKAVFNHVWQALCRAPARLSAADARADPAPDIRSRDRG